MKKRNQRIDKKTKRLILEILKNVENETEKTDTYIDLFHTGVTVSVKPMQKFILMVLKELISSTQR